MNYGNQAIITIFFYAKMWQVVGLYLINGIPPQI